ncbi:FAD/NAD(P)-binding oxidoreductase [Nocardiopsis rhodophaea]|uniref:FAD/NAD(P)-binding oxidoreductase n=1 Tax=Nocardiopsis rhodophaea TaxID=280238 RepID=A0ABN2SNB1_9ACTN
MREVVVVGGGPAGIGAALAALRAGARVTVVDTAEHLGGQFLRRPRTPAPQFGPSDHSGGPAPRRRPSGRDRLRRAVRAIEGHPAHTILDRTSVWALEPRDSAPTVHALRGDSDGGSPDHREAHTLRPDALILAPGAHDLTLPFPGWDLPGVFTAGAAQALAKSDGLAAGRRVLVAGSGPFLLPVAASLSDVGADVVGVVEAGSAGRLAAGWLRSPVGLLRDAAAGRVEELAGYLAGHVRDAIPYHVGAGVIAAHGAGRVEEATVASLRADWSPVPGTERRVAVDAVCVGHGFVPRLELPIAAGCGIGPHRAVTVDAAQHTTVPGVFAAGEATGIGGADLAVTEGVIAGWTAAGGRADDPLLRRALRTRERHRAFAARMRRAHAIGPGWPAWLTPDTLVCRCEEVPVADIDAACAVTGAGGPRSLRSLKLTTRAGLGPCQGRVCGTALTELVRRRVPHAVSSEPVDRRPIAAPIRLGELAALDTVGQTSGEDGDVPGEASAVPPARTPEGEE